MPAGLAVEPGRVTAAGARVQAVAPALALAGRDVTRTLDGVGGELAGSSAGAAAMELAAASGEATRCLVTGVDTLARALAAAAARYLDVDLLSGRP